MSLEQLYEHERHQAQAFDVILSRDGGKSEASGAGRPIWGFQTDDHIDFAMELRSELLGHSA